MLGALAMQRDEVPSIEGQHGATLADGILQDIGIADALAREPCVEEGLDVVPESSEFLHDGEREVLVREEPGQSSGLLILADLAVDLFTMAADVGPGVGQ